MNDRSLDTSRWNLFSFAGRWPAGIAAIVIGCGPAVGDQPQESSTDSNATGETTPTGTSTPGNCMVDADCNYGYACVNNYCDYNCSCGCGVAPPPGNQLRCPEGIGYYGCYSDLDCGAGEICTYGDCVPGLPCGSIPPLAETIDLQFSDALPTPVLALRFADLSQAPGTDLLVARGNAIELISEGVGAVIVQTPTPVIAFAAADFDGDTLLDLVTAEDGPDAVLRLWSNEDGAFAPLVEQPLVGARGLAIGDSDGDGSPDVFAHIGRDLVSFPWSGGAPLGSPVTLVTDRVDAMSLLDNAANVSTIVFGEGPAFWSYSAPSGDTALVGDSGGQDIDRLVVADFSGDAVPDLAGFSSPAGLTTFVGPIPTLAASYSVLAGGYIAAAAGDIDGDGRADLVVTHLETTDVLVRYGDNAEITEPYRCDTEYSLDTVGQALAVGDLDGDGIGEIAISDGTRVRLMRF